MVDAPIRKIRIQKGARMNKLTMTISLSLILMYFSPRATAGHMYIEWLDCDPTYKLFEVSWEGPWKVLGGKHLDYGTTNTGPWMRVLSFIPDSNCYFPARGLRWYRVAAPKFPIGFQTLAAIWVPRSRCWRGSIP